MLLGLQIVILLGISVKNLQIQFLVKVSIFLNNFCESYILLELFLWRYRLTVGKLTCIDPSNTFFLQIIFKFLLSVIRIPYLNNNYHSLVLFFFQEEDKKKSSAPHIFANVFSRWYFLLFCWYSFPLSQ